MSRKPQSLAELIERTEQVQRDFADEVATSKRLKSEARTLLDHLNEGIGDLERSSGAAMGRSATAPSGSPAPSRPPQVVHPARRDTPQRLDNATFLTASHNTGKRSADAFSFSRERLMHHGVLIRFHPTDPF